MNVQNHGKILGKAQDGPGRNAIREIPGESPAMVAGRNAIQEIPDQMHDATGEARHLDAADRFTTFALAAMRDPAADEEHWPVNHGNPNWNGFFVRLDSSRLVARSTSSPAPFAWSERTPEGEVRPWMEYPTSIRMMGRRDCDLHSSLILERQ